MTSFATYSSVQLDSFQEKLKTAIVPCAVYEQAAQKFAEALYNELSPDVVLARVYVTIPFGLLPMFNKAFVSDLAKTKGVAHLVNERTPILSLVGSSGRNQAWNDRHKSQGHVGIPLCSAEFIDAIPMLSRLLQELGLNLTWFDRQDLSIVEKTATGLSGLFYVADAGRDTDAKGRKIIPAQDFVVDNGIRTVFGIGAMHLGGAFAVCIVFTNTTITKGQLRPLTGLINTFKGSSSKLATPSTWLVG